MLPHFNYTQIIVGCDEAGRGCLAGDVFAAAVILPKNFSSPLLNDSKKLSAKQRLKAREIIISHAIEYAIDRCSPQEIDHLNILNASIFAMHKALKKLHTPFHKIIVDGNRFKSFMQIPHECIIKGDGKYIEIAAASILAKTERDLYMQKIHLQYPQYGWDKNKGYPTAKHRLAIEKYGITPFHRKSFTLCQKTVQMNLFQ